MDIKADQTVDARELMCPMPVMAATKARKRAAAGQVIKILATDRGALGDIPAWAAANDDELLGSAEEDGIFVFYVRKTEE
jgi:tRNA 2-thiouridine synthesizing protein A